MTYDAGQSIISNFIFGLPEDDIETMRETLELAKEINGEYANFWAAMAYPGSDLYDQALKENWKLPDCWHGYSQYAYETIPLSTKYLSGAEVLRFRDDAFQEYFTNPAYLEKIRRKFGGAAERAVIEMTRKKLKRKIYS